MCAEPIPPLAASQAKRPRCAMTEVEWDTADDPAQLLATLSGRTSERKLRLFGLFCCRQAWDMFTDPAPRGVLDAAERHADCQLTEEERAKAEFEALDAFERELERQDEFGFPATDVVRLVARTTYLVEDA